MSFLFVWSGRLWKCWPYTPQWLNLRSECQTLSSQLLKWVVRKFCKCGQENCSIYAVLWLVRLTYKLTTISICLHCRTFWKAESSHLLWWWMPRRSSLSASPSHPPLWLCKPFRSLLALIWASSLASRPEMSDTNTLFWLLINRVKALFHQSLFLVITVLQHNKDLFFCLIDSLFT